MKVLTVSALLCAMMALITAAALPAEEANHGTEVLLLRGEHHVAKPKCPHGWMNYSKRCFVYVFHPLSWAQAQRNCDRLGANLASVHSLEEYHFIQEMIFSVTRASRKAWIGGSDAQENGYWFWIDGTQLRYTNWCPGQPAGYYWSEQCMQMNYSEHTCWDDTYCYTELPSICVKNV